MGKQNEVVEKAENLFSSVHQIILSFIFELGVFLPPLVNAVLIGFAVGTLTSSIWGYWAGVISGLIAASAIEVMGIILSWNLQGWNYWLIPLYILGSWLLVLFGLPIDKVTTTVGIIMPVFAVATQNIVSKRKRREEETNKEKEKSEQEILKLKEETKQARAKARAAKAQNLVKSDTKISKNDVMDWLQSNKEAPTGEVVRLFGISDQTVRNYKKELNGN